jgi:uncharacterized alpha-E superfamily protein
LHVLLHALVRQDDDNDPSAAPPTLRDLVLDPDLPRSVAGAAQSLAACAQAVRDQLSTDTFGPLARIDRALDAGRSSPETDPPPAPPAPDEQAAVVALGREGVSATEGLRPVLDEVLESLLAIAGIAAEGLVRDVGWSFLDAGRRLERAQHVVDTLQATTVRVGPPEVDQLVLESLLLLHDSVITYRRRYPAETTVPGVLDLLVHDRANPRSLACSVDQLRDDLRAVPTSRRPADQRDQLLADVAALESELDTVVAGQVTGGGRRDRLAEALDSMKWRLRAAHDEIEQAHFAPTVPPRPQPDLWGRPNTATGGSQ